MNKQAKHVSITAADTYEFFADEQTIVGDVGADLDRMQAQAYDTIKLHAKDFGDVQNSVLVVNRYQDACDRLLAVRRQARQSLQDLKTRNGF